MHKADEHLIVVTSTQIYHYVLVPVLEGLEKR